MTRKPLADLIPDILTHINNNREYLAFDHRLYRFYEGQVSEEIKLSLSQEMVSKSAFNRAIQRIPSINIVKKVNDKLSKVYNEPALRMCNNKNDADLLKAIAQKCGLENQLITANRMTNLNRRSALELYIDDNALKVKVLAAHQFLVYSDNIIDPNKPTVFIKLMPKMDKRTTVTVDRNGNKLENPYEEIIVVETYALYSDTEFMVIDSSGDIREDIMNAMGVSSTENPFGVIPFVYINTSKLELLPYPNKTALDIGILIPKLLTDLNYSAQFLSHSVIWTKNADLAGAEINPDAIVHLGDTDAATGAIPEIGTINPETDIDGVLKLIEFQLSSYLTTEGLKAGGIGNMDANQESSGVSKIIDESDATDARKNQMEIFRDVEKDLWFKIAKIQETGSRTGSVEEKRLFTSNFPLNMSVRFSEIRPLESEKQKYEKIKIGRDLKLLTRKQALQELYPDLNEEQLMSRLKDVEDELMKEKEEMLDMGITPGFTQFANKTTTATNKGTKEPDDSIN